MRIGKKSFDLIVTEEVGSKARYTKLYQGAVDPGGASGPTVGIGYDLKHHTRRQIVDDWSGLIPEAMVDKLALGAGKDGPYAKQMKGVKIPWDAAIAQFERGGVPEWEDKTAKALPNTELLPPDAFGVLVSLTYNRGPLYYNLPSSRDKSGRGIEMRAIRKAMATKNFEVIPAQLRAMKRLWAGTSVAGVAGRREREAALFEKSLATLAVAMTAPAKNDVGDDRYAEPDIADGELTVDKKLSDEKGRDVIAMEAIPYDEQVYQVQCRLRDLGYFTVGEPDGRNGTATRDAILIFRRNNSLPLSDEIDEAFLAALSVAGKKPVADTRATATATDIAPKVETVRQTRLQRVWAWLLGLPGMIWAAVQGTVSAFGDATDQAAPFLGHVRTAFGAVPGWLWGAGLVGAAFLIWRSSSKVETDTVDKWQEGRLL